MAPRRMHIGGVTAHPTWTGTLILNQAHLRAVLAEYQKHYNPPGPIRASASASLALIPVPALPPQPRHVADPPKPVLSGLINEHERAAWRIKKAQVKSRILFSSSTDQESALVLLSPVFEDVQVVEHWRTIGHLHVLL
jgi:hypothetical protein